MQLEIVNWRTNSSGSKFHAICKRAPNQRVDVLYRYKDNNEWVFLNSISLEINNPNARIFKFNIPDTDEPLEYLKENYPEIFISEEKFLETYPEFKL